MYMRCYSQIHWQLRAHLVGKPARKSVQIQEELWALFMSTLGLKSIANVTGSNKRANRNLSYSPSELLPTRSAVPYSGGRCPQKAGLLDFQPPVEAKGCSPRGGSHIGLAKAWSQVLFEAMEYNLIHHLSRALSFNRDCNTYHHSAANISWD